MALRKPQETIEERPRRSRREGVRDPKRWVIPIGGGLLAAILIVLATPHVPLALRLVLGVIALAYIAGQSAAYLWTSDQG